MRTKRRLAVRLLLFLTLASALARAPKAQAAIYFTGSISQSTTNVPLEKSTMEYANAAIDIDLGRFFRVGINYGNEISTTSGYQLPTTTTSSPGSTQQVSCPTTTSCVPVVNKTTIVERGGGLTILLWNGDVFMPYIMVGAVMKSYVFENQINGGPINELPGATKIVPNLGAGLGIRLNRDFMLKLSYQASPGVNMDPGGSAKVVWDRKATVGLSYQIN